MLPLNFSLNTKSCYLWPGRHAERQPIIPLWSLIRLCLLPISMPHKLAVIAICIRVGTSLIFSSVKLHQSKAQSLPPGVGGVSMGI